MNLDLTKIVLKSGAHKAPPRFTEETPACLLEVVAMFKGEPFSDQPACACPVIAAFGRRLNDRITDEAHRTRILMPLVPLIAGSRSTRTVEIRRAYVAADFAIREALPMALDAAKLPDEAKRVRELAPLVDKATAVAAEQVAREVRKKAADAAYDAHAAAYAAHAADAAYDAYAAAYAAADAYAAAAYAYAAAAYAYAAADAADAAYAAARHAARVPIWEAAAACLRRMCEVTEG